MHGTRHMEFEYYTHSLLELGSLDAWEMIFCIAKCLQFENLSLDVVCVRACVRSWFICPVLLLIAGNPFVGVVGDTGLPSLQHAGWLSEMILNVLTHDRFSHCLLPNLRLNFDFATMNSFSNSQFPDRLRFMCLHSFTLQLSGCVVCQ